MPEVNMFSFDCIFWGVDVGKRGRELDDTTVLLLQ